MALVAGAVSSPSEDLPRQAQVGLVTQQVQLVRLTRISMKLGFLLIAAGASGRCRSYLCGGCKGRLDRAGP